MMLVSAWQAKGSETTDLTASVKRRLWPVFLAVQRYCTTVEKAHPPCRLLP